MSLIQVIFEWKVSMDKKTRENRLLSIFADSWAVH